MGRDFQQTLWILWWEPLFNKYSWQVMLPWFHVSVQHIRSIWFLHCLHCLQAKAPYRCGRTCASQVQDPWQQVNWEVDLWTHNYKETEHLLQSNNAISHELYYALELTCKILHEVKATYLSKVDYIMIHRTFDSFLWNIYTTS